MKHNYPLCHLLNIYVIGAFVIRITISHFLFDFISHIIVYYVDYSDLSLCIVVQILYCSYVFTPHRFFIIVIYDFFTLFLLSEYSQEFLIIKVICRVHARPFWMRVHFTISETKYIFDTFTYIRYKYIF